MVAAIYKRNKPKEKWVLQAFDESIEKAKDKIKKMSEAAKKSQMEKAEFAVQVFGNQIFIPEFLNEIQPDKMNYN